VSIVTGGSVLLVLCIACIEVRHTSSRQPSSFRTCTRSSTSTERRRHLQLNVSFSNVVSLCTLPCHYIVGGVRFPHQVCATPTHGVHRAGTITNGKIGTHQPIHKHETQCYDHQWPLDDFFFRQVVWGTIKLEQKKNSKKNVEVEKISRFRD
jgi:hypothetical protein